MTALEFHRSAVFGLFARTSSRTIIYIVIEESSDSYFTYTLTGLVPTQVYIEPPAWPSSPRAGFEQCELVTHALYYDMDLSYNTLDARGSLRQGPR